MKRWVIVVCLLAMGGIAHAAGSAWQPSAGHVQIPIWPGTPPDAHRMPGPEYSKTGHKLYGGRPITGVYNVARPTMTVYAPSGRNTGAAVVVFPGGGFAGLAIDLEGTEVCDWLTSEGITCVLLKYRVPSVPYDWHCKCRPDDFAVSLPSLQDAQRTLRLVRSHAAKWRIDPHKVGVIGFSAGGFLVAETSTLFKRRFYPPVDAADRQSDRPDFAMAIYPGHLASDADKLNPNVPVSRGTPPTFLVQAEDDYVDGVNQALVYYMALAKAHVPAEMHLYAHGGHAFGLRRTRLPITGWPKLADAWMRRIGVIPDARR
ncbi:alpha/beta hydrolase [Dyella sp. A6]|uniref:alpha/beta hydrolase n=1 Tax=Dyella aluminiiresistens TaxID=3069105 RepID=UPI002E789EA1|nr:alpha/beta hydrolase [Dyella sp. A6]